MLGKAAAFCAVLALALLGATPVAAASDNDRGGRHHDDTFRWAQWVFSHDRDRDSDDESSDDSDSSDDSSDSGDDSTVAGGAVVVTGSEKSIQAELTGYSYQDNTPPGSADICCPILHQKAGGTGTFADPITTAVASNSFPPGTKFYIPKVKRYVIVEDSGASDGENHLDIWVGGQGHSKSDSDACMNSYTGTATIIQNPADGKPVTSGELTTSGGCKI